MAVDVFRYKHDPSTYLSPPFKWLHDSSSLSVNFYWIKSLITCEQVFHARMCSGLKMCYFFNLKVQSWRVSADVIVYIHFVLLAWYHSTNRMNYFYQIDLEKEKDSFLNSNTSNLRLSFEWNFVTEKTNSLFKERH